MTLEIGPRGDLVRTVAEVERCLAGSAPQRFVGRRLAASLRAAGPRWSLFTEADTMGQMSDVEIDGTSLSIDGTRRDSLMCCCLGRTRLDTHRDDGRQVPFGRRGRPWSGVPLPPRGSVPVCLRCPDRVAPASLALRSCLPGLPDRGPVLCRRSPREVVPRRVGFGVVGVPALSAPESRLALAVFRAAMPALRTEFRRVPRRGLDVLCSVAFARGLEFGALLAGGHVREAPGRFTLDVDEFAVRLVRSAGGALESGGVHALAANALVALGEPDGPGCGCATG